MLARTKRFFVLSVMALSAAVISLPVASFAAVSPAVTVLSPLTAGLRAPVRVALDASGNVYVADGRSGGVVKFNAAGSRLLTIPTDSAPVGLAVAQDGTLIVAQATSVARYNVLTGAEAGRLKGGNLQAVTGVAVNDGNGYIYVADGKARQIEVYTASGLYVDAFGSATLLSTAGIAFEKKAGYLAVADISSNKVQFFDVNGNYGLKMSIGNPIAGGTTAVYSGTIAPMQFSAPVAVAFQYGKDALSRIYVVDAYQGNVQVVNPETTPASALNVAGSTTNFIGSSGTASGQLMVPSDVAFDAVNSRLLVVNGFGNVTIYGIDGGKNPVEAVALPSLTVNPLLATVTVPNITVSGTMDAGASVFVSTGSPTLAGAVVYPSATTWKSDVTGLVGGNNTITVTAKDAAGNSALPVTVSTKYQLPAPAMTVAAVSALTNVSNIVLSGTVDSGATVTVTNNSTSLSGTATVIGSDWTYSVSLAEGANSITVVAQKPVSDKAAAALSITLDTTKPQLAVSALADGSYTATQVQNITGTASDANAVAVYVNKVAATLTNGVFSVPVTLLAGANTVTVVANDAAGNTTLDSRTLNYDATKPEVNILSPMDNSITNNASLQISGTLNEAATVTAAGISALVDSKGNWSATVQLTAGPNTIQVIATDLAGNTSSQKRSVTFDAVKPVLAITSPVQDSSTKNASITISGSVSDSSAVNVAYSVNGGTVAPVKVNNGAFAFNVDLPKKAVYQVLITATDAAGNVATTTRNITKTTGK